MMGLGSIGQRHLRNIYAKFGPEVEVIVTKGRGKRHVLRADMSLDANVRFEEAYPVTVYPTLDEALAQKPDVAFICTPTSLHMEGALRAATAGCHIFLEKPISDDLEHLEELRALRNRHGTTIYVGYMWRFHPLAIQLRTEILSQSVGRLLAVHIELGEHLPSWHPYEDYRISYAARKDLGGGSVLSQIHDLDFVYWVFGNASSVAAIGGHYSDLDMDVEDSYDALLGMELFGSPVPVSIHVDCLQKVAVKQITVIGCDGRLVADGVAGTLQKETENGRTDLIDCAAFDRNTMFQDQLDHFFACVAGTETPLVSLEDGEGSLRMALLIRAAIERGSP